MPKLGIYLEGLPSVQLAQVCFLTDTLTRQTTNHLDIDTIDLFLEL